MLSDQKLQKFHKTGFVKGSKVLSDDQVDVLRDETLRIIDEHIAGTLQSGDARKPVHITNLKESAENPVWQIVNIWEASPAFEQLLVYNEHLIEEVAQVLQLEANAREIRLFHDQIVYKPAETGGINRWHQDSPMWHVLSPQDVHLSAWIALDDVDEENGCMSMVPGSHRWGDRLRFLHRYEDLDSLPSTFEGHTVEVVSCPVAKGEVHFHHPLTWHSSPANRSTRHRRAIALHYMSERAVFEPEGEHVMKPFIDVPSGETVKGPHFPLVWQVEQ